MTFNEELNRKYNEPVSQILSYEESAIDRLIANIESSSNPTLDLLHIMELANTLSYKLSKKIDKGKNLLGGKYTINDKVPKTNTVSEKVFNSKLNMDQKILLLHIYGDKNPGLTLSYHLQNNTNDNFKHNSSELNSNNIDNNLKL